MLRRPEDFQKFVAAVRLKPGLYLGASGTPAVVRAAWEILHVIIKLVPRRYCGPVTVSIEDGLLSLQFHELLLRALSPTAVDAWTKSLRRTPLVMLTMAVGYSDQFTIESSDGNSHAVWHFSEAGIKTQRSRRRGKPSLNISFRPINNFGHDLTDEQIYQIGGMLKDLCALRPGLGAVLRSDRWEHETRYHYTNGLCSLLFEEDYARYSLHPGCISFKGRNGDLRVEGHLRFLHAGPPRVRSWVNLHPTKGGAHLEGLGEALHELFPDADRGCRVAQFITNSNTGAAVKLPHSFIGAIQLEMDEPLYEGPTKDILLGNDVRNFVRAVALKFIPDQWRRLRAAKRL